MFQECKQLEDLDLSNFDSSNVIDMRIMFYKCSNLKYLNLLNFRINDLNEGMFSFIESSNCEFICNNKKLNNLFYA